MPKGAILSAERVAEIYVDADKSVGSGYFLTPRIVLTAKHVIASAVSIDDPLPAPQSSDGADYISNLAGTRPRCRVRTLSPQSGGFVDAIVVWCSSGADVALIGLIAPSFRKPPLPPLVWADLSDSKQVSISAVGFPAAVVEGRIRESRQISGHVNPLSGVKAGHWVVHVAEQIGPRLHGEISPWAGLSGAALFADNCLIGVMQADADPRDPNRLELWALPARAFADDLKFVRWVCWDGGDRAWTRSDLANEPTGRKVPFIIPHQDNRNFSGREPELKALAQVFFECENSLSMVAVTERPSRCRQERAVCPLCRALSRVFSRRSDRHQG